MPWYKISCKRPCFHDDYLPAFNRDNVTLVDTDGKGVDRVTPKGVVVGDTEYPVDCSSTRRASSCRPRLPRTVSASTRSARAACRCRRRGPTARTRCTASSPHGFPNLCMNSALQGGQHINIAYASTRIAQHIA